MQIKTQIKLCALLFVLAFLATPSAVFAQSFSLGADFVSRYVWRGYDFGESLSAQPALTFSSGGFEIGAWGSYAIAGEGGGANELDLWLGYSIELSNSASVSFGVTDYHFPAPGSEYFDFDDGEGAHVIEPYVSFTGPETFPVTLYGAMNVYNDEDNSLYVEASVPFEVEGVELGLTAGVIANESAYYGTEGFALVNLGLSASKEIPISSVFSLPVFVSYIINPDLERAYLVFGISL